MALAGPVTKYGLCSYCTVLSLRDSLSPGAPHSNGVTYHANRPTGGSSLLQSVHLAVRVEVCVELVGAASAAKAEEEEAEDVDGCEAAVDGGYGVYGLRGDGC